MADTALRRSIDLGDWESVRSVSRGAAVGVASATILLAGLLCAGPAAMTSDLGPAKDVVFSGRVIERETGKPVEGAEIVLERSVRGSAARKLPAWAGESLIRTDAEGKFRIEFPAEQVAERRLWIAMWIRHPGFIWRKSSRVALADLIRGQARGEEPFFANLTLERGAEYTGQVVVPGGKPAAGIPYVFENGTSGTSRPFPLVMDDHEGQTDDDGRIRLRMPKTQALALFVGPPRTAGGRFPFAPYQHFWGTETASRHPDVWAPTDLGRIVLSRRIRLPGRLVNTEDRPIAGQTITAYPLRGRDRHSTTTEADGSFALGPLRPANYLIYGEGQGQFSGVDFDAPRHLRPVRVVRPVRVYFKEGTAPEPLVLREMPTVRVELRFVDSKGEPAVGSPTRLSGLLPQDPARAFRPLAHIKGSDPTSSINAQEPENPGEPYAWDVQDRPDEDGRIVFHAPRGLRDATIYAPPADETTAFKHRIDPDGPILPGPPARLGILEGDRRMTMIEYRAPTVIVAVKTEDGGVPTDLSVIARHRIGRQGYGNLFVRQADGRYRSQSLMPEHEYEISVSARNGVYDRAPLQRANLPESGSADLSFVLRKRRKPPGVGEPAPPFAVKTIDGRTLSLATLRGKTILLHFWQPAPRTSIPDVTFLQAVHDRFGSDARFVMIGLCLSDDSEAVTRVIRSARSSWPHAMLRDRGNDPIVVDYQALQPDVTFLIGPDGKLIARGLRGAALEKAVAEILGGK